VNDAGRLSQDPSFRLIGSEKIWERGAALTSRLQSFEPEMLAEEQNFAGLTRISREPIAKVEAIDSRRRVVLDTGSTETPVHGQQEQSAYNGHFESTCYHPLLLFNREGGCLAGKLRPGNVHSADGWEEVLLPEIDWQQKQGKQVMFRTRPRGHPGLRQARDLRDAGRAGREVRDPAAGQRLSGARHSGVAGSARGSALSQAGGALQGLSVLGGELEHGAAGDGEGGVPLWGTVPSRGVHRDQPGHGQPGDSAVLQQARHRRAVDQGSKQAVKMTRLSCHRFRSNEVRLWLSLIAYNLGTCGGGWCCHWASATGR